jgi:hypothetical protein
MITNFLLSLLLNAEPGAGAKAPPAPTPIVSADEQIQLLKLQLDEVVNELNAANAKIRLLNGVSGLRDAWNKRDCKVEPVPPENILVRCAAQAPPEMPAKVDAMKPEPKK